MWQKENPRNLLLCHFLGSKVPKQSAFSLHVSESFYGCLIYGMQVSKGVVSLREKNRGMYIYPIFLEAEAQSCTFKKLLMNRCSHFPGIWASEISPLVLSRIFVLLPEVSPIGVSFKLTRVLLKNSIYFWLTGHWFFQTTLNTSFVGG